MGLIDKILSIFGGGSSTGGSTPPAEPAETAPEPDPDVEANEAEADEDEDEAEDDGGMSTKSVAEMADPRRREDEDNTVHNRAENPDDQRAT